MNYTPPVVHELDIDAGTRINELAAHWRVLLDRFAELRDAASRREGVYNVIVAVDGGCWFEVAFGGRTVRFEIALRASASAVGARVSCSLRLQVGSAAFTYSVFFSFEIESSGQTNFTTDKGRIVTLSGHPGAPSAIVDHVMVAAMSASLDGSTV